MKVESGERVRAIAYEEVMRIYRETSNTLLTG